MNENIQNSAYNLLLESSYFTNQNEIEEDNKIRQEELNRLQKWVELFSPQTIADFPPDSWKTVHEKAVECNFEPGLDGRGFINKEDKVVIKRTHVSQFRYDLLSNGAIPTVFLPNNWIIQPVADVVIENTDDRQGFIKRTQELNRNKLFNDRDNHLGNWCIWKGKYRMLDW